MAHKTKINSTAYDITGGKTLVSGTSYSIKNGKVLIGGTAYDISFVLPPAVLDLWSSSSTLPITSIAYGNGYWVAAGRYYRGSTSYARIAYAASLNGTWTTKDLWDNGYIYSVTYVNNTWVVGGWFDDDSAAAGYARIAYTTNPSGTWTIKDVWSGSDAGNRNGVNCITYADGYWVVGGRYYNDTNYYARIAYATSLSGSWTTKNCWYGDVMSNGIYCVAYANGYWVIGGEYDTGTGYARISYATTPSGTWTNKDLWNTTNASGSEIYSIAYGNGYWVVGGRYYNKSRTTYYARIAYATSPSGTWTNNSLWKGGSNTSSNVINCVTYADGYWVVGGVYWPTSRSTKYARIAYATSPNGTWTNKDLWDSNSSNGIKCIVYGNKHWVAGGEYYDTTYDARIAYAGSPGELGNTE